MQSAQLWKEQCEAAQGIRDDHGVQKALGYLVGEKFLNVMRYCSSHPELKLEIEPFAARIRELFAAGELRSYFRNVSRVGALGHVVDDDTHRGLADHGFTSEGPADAAEDVLLLEQARKLILG